MSKFLFKILLWALTVVSISAVVSAKDFGKTVTYTEGQFKDVAEKAWYASDVKSAYELGFVNGKSDTLFVPEGNVTVAEGITMATRVHSIYNGKTIAEKTSGKWYDMYISYALENGMIKEGQFTNFDRNIMRYEMALLFANSLPSDYFAAKNDIKDIPDVAETEDYYDELLMLYRAGVVLGSDDYGNFYATNPIKRSETAAIINRVALPENRVSGTLKEYGNREQAVYLIDDLTMSRSPRNIQQKLASGWRYEDMGNPAINAEFVTSNALPDDNDDARIAIHRDVTVQTKGKVKVEAFFTVSKNNGAEIIFNDIYGTQLFKLAIVDGKYVAYGDKEQATNISASDIAKQKSVYFELDLDEKTAKLVIDSADAGTYSMNKAAKNLARMSYATTKEEKVLLSVVKTKMYVNYDVNDAFALWELGKAPYGWNVTGKVTVEANTGSTYDRNSVKIDGAGKAVKKFSPVSEKFVYETFILPTKTSKGYVAIKNGEKEALKVEFDASKFINGGKVLREFDDRCWHLVRVEADTETNKATIKLNNKVYATVDFAEDKIDTVEIVNNGNEVLWFDDVKVYNVFDYADYVPTPVSVTDDEWLVGMSVCSLWREGSHYGWDCISPYDEITPVIGCFDEGLPEVADWEIKFLVEHGYDFQHYCWYLFSQGDAPIKDTRLADAITNGYMNAKYSDMMDMMIMWENQSCSRTSPEFFYEYVWPYWCEWYFEDSRYLRIDNKCPITIYSYQRFIENLGGMEKAKEVVAFMREDIKRLGYDDIILFGCPTFLGFSEEQMKTAQELGIEALLSYTFGELAYEADYQKTAMMTSYNRNVLAQMPCIGVGFNDIGWTEERTPLATAEAHKEVMQWSKDTYMPLLAERYGENWKSKMVFHTTWNEFGEGHWIFPSNLNGFGYVDGNRAVFSSVSGKDDKAHFDITPTDNQKARLGYLYPARTVPMRREQMLVSESGETKYASVKTWNFENQADALMWVKMNQTTDPYYDEIEKALVCETTGNDGNIQTLTTTANYVNADKAKTLHVRMKMPKGEPTAINLFFVHDTKEGWSAEKGISKRISPDGEYQDYYIDLTANALWKGEIARLRFDPCSYPSKFYIKTIEFLSDSEEGTYTLNVDGTEFFIEKEFAQMTDDGLVVAGNPTKGFYSSLNIYHEYNRVNGTLDLYGNNGSKMHFEVGSDKALIDGKTVTLSKATERIDGLVAVPLKLICETFGYKYEQDGSTVKVTVREGGAKETEKIENQFEFDVAGDLENFEISAATGTVSSGKLVLTAKPVTYTPTGFDPQIVNKKVYINTKIYQELEIRYKPVYAEGVDASNDRLSVYFGTTVESGLDEKKTFKVKHTDLTPDSEGFLTAKLDCTKNEKWTGYITTLRIDPGNYEGYYEIDYIRISPNENTAALLQQEQEDKKAREEAQSAADNGGPFFIENADAENVDSKANLTTGSTTVTIVEDDLREGNHAYLLVPANDRQTWTYFRANTRFKAGATYKVEFDLRILTDLDGNAGVDVTSKVNPRYTDMVNGAVKNSADHPLNKEVVTQSASDGWVRHSFTFTVNNNLDIRDNDQFTVFIDPKGDANNYTNFCAMLDNFVVTVVE